MVPISDLDVVLANESIPEGFKSVLRFLYLKEFDQAVLAQSLSHFEERAFGFSVHMNDYDNAMMLYDNLPQERQMAAVNLEELSVLQAASGQYQASIDTLKQAHNDEIRIHGILPPISPRANCNLAANTVHCLKQLDRNADASEILASLQQYMEELKLCSTRAYSFLELKLAILTCDRDLALTLMEGLAEQERLAWYSRFDPILQTMKDEPRFQAVYRVIDEKINARRVQFSLPPK